MAETSRSSPNRDFLKLLLSQTVSGIGSQISLVALPLVAAAVLQATPAQMGVLVALETLPFVLVGLLAGVWVDRWRRLPILITTDVIRGIFLLSIPIMAWLGMLRLELLYVVGFVVGTASVFFDIAQQSYLPSLVSRAELIEGNSKMELSRSAAQLVGPGLGGAIVQAFTAPLAVGIDALSFLLSAISLRLIRQREEAPRTSSAPQSIFASIREGLAVVFGHPIMRAAAACSATGNFFHSINAGLFVLYATRELHVSAISLGFIFAASSGGALLASFLVRRLTNRLGLGRTFIATHLLMGASALLIPLVPDGSLMSILILGTSTFLTALGTVVFNINSRSLRQAVAPEKLLGRVNASVRFIVWSTMPLGALAGGVLAEFIGMRVTLLLVGAGILVAPLWIIASPVAAMKDIPERAP